MVADVFLVPMLQPRPQLSVDEAGRFTDDDHNDFARLIAEIRETHRLRQDLLREQTALTNRIAAIARRLTGETRDEYTKRIARGEVHPMDDVAEAAAIPLTDARAVLKPHLARLESRLGKLAMQLPVWPWVDGVRGFGAVGLAQIIGETGDLSLYANPAKVWKRMGLAVMPDGQRQRRVTGDEAIAHGYNPRRRSVMFVIGDSLIKGNRDGEYRTLYLARKEYERERAPDDAPIAHHRRAQRYMEKRLLKNLWCAWRAATWGGQDD